VILLQGAAQLYIRVIDRDWNSDDHVDDVYIELELPSPSSISYQYYTGDYENSEIEIRYRLHCLGDYYGPDCARYCVDTDSIEGHYSCDTDGNKICNTGWTNPSLSCTTGGLHHYL